MNFVPPGPVGADGGLFLSALQQQHLRGGSAAAAVETTEHGEVIVRHGDITVHDVLLGRGRGPNMHPGNQRYRQIIYANRDNYNKACNRTEQTRITREIVNHIKQNGRFLKRLETPNGGPKKKKKRGEVNSDAWVAVDDATARLKVGQCLRYKLRQDAEQNEDGSLDGVPVETRPYEGAKYSGGAILPTLETSTNFVEPDSLKPAAATQPSRKFRKVALPQEPALDMEELKVLHAINRSGLLVPDADSKDLDGFVESPMWEAKADIHVLPDESEEGYMNTVAGGYYDNMLGTGDSYDSNLAYGSDLISDAEVLSALGYPQLPTQPTETRPTILCYCGCRVNASEAHKHKHHCALPKNGIFSMPGAVPLGNAGTLRKRSDSAMTDSYDNMICGTVSTGHQDTSSSRSSSQNIAFPVMTPSNNNNNMMSPSMWHPALEPTPMNPTQSAPPGGGGIGNNVMFQIPNSAPLARPLMYHNLPVIGDMT